MKINKFSTRYLSGPTANLRIVLTGTFSFLIIIFLFAAAVSAQTLPGTDLFTDTEDCTKKNTRLITAFLNGQIAESEQHRAKHWNRNFGSEDAYNKSVGKNRERFRRMIGIRDQRKAFDASDTFNTCGMFNTSSLIAVEETHNIYAVRWTVFDDLNGEGLLLEPIERTGKSAKTQIIIPPAGVTPEQFIGLDNSGGIGCPGISDVRYIIPVIVNRDLQKRGRSTLTNREYIYRPAYQLGRHIIGYEVQEILALVDGLKKENANAEISIAGHEEGGLLAMYAAACDTCIDSCRIDGYFDNRNHLCDEPIDRNVFGLLREFGDAEIASLIAPRKLIVRCAAPVNELVLKSEKGGAPGKIAKPDMNSVKAEIERAKKLTEPLKDWIEFDNAPQTIPVPLKFTFIAEKEKRPDTVRRMNRIIDGMDKHTQSLLNKAELTRRDFWAPLDNIKKVQSPEWNEKMEWYRNYFAQEVVGQFDIPLADLSHPKAARTRKKEETDKYTMYETELDVFDKQYGGGIVIYGLMLIPKDIKDGEKRPVIVCQHGLERRPEVTLRGGRDAYSGFATELCERGYITFAPQGIFTGGDKFRYNQRQLNSLGKTLFSIMVPQHQQLVNWLGTLPFVDKEKIAFYGLSYGGQTAMFVPPLVKNYCLSICSANFNAWNIKCASTLYPFSYIWSGEYEMFEFDLANTFDYSDMARLIAPRPFMVERGYTDGVGWDEFVGFEYAKVRRFYAYRLRIPERTEIHWFDGGHKISGEKTYPFLDKHLRQQ